MTKKYYVNAEDLRDRYRIKCDNRTKIYKKLLEKCYYRIKNTADNDNTYFIYPIPDFVLGIPKYNLAYCAAFIIHDLRNKGFVAKFFNPNIIFISWHFNIPSFTNNGPKRITYNKPNITLDKPKQVNITLDKPIQTKFKSISDYQPTGNFIRYV